MGWNGLPYPIRTLLAQIVSLLTDAEMGEDVVEGLLGSDSAFACDVGEVGKDETKVFGDEVTAELGGETIEHSEEVGVGMGECFVMTCRGDDDVVL